MRLLLLSLVMATSAIAQSFSCATGSNHCVQVTWVAPTTGSTPTSYIVKRSTVSGGPYAVVGTPLTTSFIDNSTSTNLLTEGTTYFYVVTSFNSTGESTPSNEASAKIPAPPDPPVSVSATSK